MSPTGYEVGAYRDLAKIARALERLNDVHVTGRIGGFDVDLRIKATTTKENKDA